MCLAKSRNLSEIDRRRLAYDFMTPGEYDELSCRFLADRLKPSLATHHQSVLAPPLGERLNGESESDTTKLADYQVLSSRRDVWSCVEKYVAMGQPLIISGPSGSGKTSLIQHFRRCAGKTEYVDFHVLQVGEICSCC